MVKPIGVGDFAQTTFPFLFHMQLAEAHTDRGLELLPNHADVC